MRAREFTINVPITIKINGDNDPEIDVPGNEEDSEKLKDNPVMVPPLQQEIELQKAAQGKKSPVIQDLKADNELGSEEEKPVEIGATDSEGELERLRSLVKFPN